MVLACAAAVVFSGCAGGEGPQAQPSVAPAADPQVTADSGSIAGVVVDDESNPVGAAEVAIIESGSTTFTDAEGRFTFNELAPGAYSILVQKLGFESAAPKRVSVTAGETTDVAFTLVTVYIPVARQSTIVQGGRIEAAVVVPAVTSHLNQTGTQSRDHYYEAAPDLVSAVSGLVWTPTTGASAKRMVLSLWVATAECNDVCTQLAVARGPSPVVVRTDAYGEEIDGEEGFQFNTYAGVESCWRTAGTTTYEGECSGQPDSIVQVVVDQAFTVYSTLFHVEPGPPDYSPLPPG